MKQLVQFLSTKVSSIFSARFQTTAAVKDSLQLVNWLIQHIKTFSCTVLSFWWLSACAALIDSRQGICLTAKGQRSPQAKNDVHRQPSTVITMMWSLLEMQRSRKIYGYRHMRHWNFENWIWWQLYKRLLAPTTTNLADPSPSPELIETIFKSKLQDREANQLVINLGTEPVKVREQGEKVIQPKSRSQSSHSAEQVWAVEIRCCCKVGSLSNKRSQLSQS